MCVVVLQFNQLDDRNTLPTPSRRVQLGCCCRRHKSNFRLGQWSQIIAAQGETRDHFYDTWLKGDRQTYTPARRGWTGTTTTIIRLFQSRSGGESKRNASLPVKPMNFYFLPQSMTKETKQKSKSIIESHNYYYHWKYSMNKRGVIICPEARGGIEISWEIKHN